MPAPPDAPKRPNYFQSQFLVVRDFQDEQNYHEESLRRHNRLLHEWGVVRDGLQVSKPGDFVISPGSAIDSLGREIILETSHTLNAAQVAAARGGTNADVFVTIEFHEEKSDKADDKYPPPGGAENVTRMMQSPSIVATKTPASDGSVLILARIAENGTVNNAVRKVASSVIARGTNLNLGDVSLDGPLSFTSKTSPNPTYPQVGFDFDPAGDQLRIRARSQSASVLDTTHVTIKRDTGNVGIGTTNPPGQKLEVVGALKLGGTPSVTPDHLAAYFWNQSNVGPTIGGYGFEVQTSGGGISLRIDNTGNLGIGTTRPVTRLHVAGSGTGLPATTGTTQSAGHSVRLRGTTNQVLDIGSARDKGHWLQSTDLSDLSKNYPFLLNPNGGNVGIGTPEPVTKLHVVGSGSAFPVATSRAQSAGHVVRLKGSTDAILDIGAAETSFWLQSTDYTNLSASHALLLNAIGGNVGIGTTAPRTALHVRRDSASGMGATLTLMNGSGGPNAQVAIDFHTYWVDTRPLPSARIICEDNSQGTGNLIFQTKTKQTVTPEKMFERMRIDASGKVGIGTSEPKAYLDIGGTDTNEMKVILARLLEGHPNTYLGVKAISTQPASEISFALEHYFHNTLNSAINFHRGGSDAGGFVTVAVNRNLQQMTIDSDGVKVQGGISCGGKIGLKSAYATNKWLSARPTDEVKMQGQFAYMEEFTLVMACSREFKENISDLTAIEAMATLQNLRPVKYDYKGEKAFRQNLGFIAEDMPDNLSSEDRKSISPFEVVPILTKVAKEQQRVIAELQETVRTLQTNATKKHKPFCG